MERGEGLKSQTARVKYFSLRAKRVAGIEVIIFDIIGSCSAENSSAGGWVCLVNFTCSLHESLLVTTSCSSFHFDELKLRSIESSNEHSQYCKMTCLLLIGSPS